MMRRQAIGRNLLGLAVCLACTAGASAQATGGKPPAAPGKGEVYISAVTANIPAAPDKAAAIVNGEMISMAEVKALLESRPYPNPVTKEEAKNIRQAALDMLVEDLLMRQFLAKNAPKVSPADVTKAMQEVQDDLKKQNKTLAEFLKVSGQSIEQVQKSVVAKQQWLGYLQVRVTEEQAKKYYDDNKPFFDKILVRASHILIKVPANATAEQKQALLNKAQTIRQEIVAGKLTFEAAVTQYSECPSKDKKGDIGPFQYKFVVVEPFAKAAFALKINELSDVVTTDFGYHIIKVTDRTQPKEVSTYASVRLFIREIWAQDVELYQQIIAHQRKNSKVEVFLQ